jgi:hypothetical protein
MRTTFRRQRQDVPIEDASGEAAPRAAASAVDGGAGDRARLAWTAAPAVGGGTGAGAEAPGRSLGARAWLRTAAFLRVTRTAFTFLRAAWAPFAFLRAGGAPFAFLGAGFPSGLDP